MSDFDDSLQIFDNITRDNLYPKLLNQLNKDFQYSGLSVGFQIDIPPAELCQYLVAIIYRLINNDFSDYLNLLYRVDISESEIKSLSGSDIEKLSNEVARLILKRECQKVWLRNRL